jgi:fatty-acyl-CoA synthase
MGSISRWVQYHSVRTPDKTAVVYDDVRISYGELRRRIGALGAMLSSHGIQRGDKVALLMKNSPAFLEIAFAVSHIGAVLVPINFRLAPSEVDYILRDSEAAMLFRDEEFSSCDAHTRLTITLSVDAQRDASTLALGFDPVPAAFSSMQELFRVMYTSGTTDRPKGVMHSYENFYAKSGDQIVALGLSPRTRLLVCGPLYHVGAFDLPGIAVLWVGGTLCVQREFEPSRTLEFIERERINSAWMAPVMSGALVTCQTQVPRDVSSLEWTIGGGERTPESRIIAFQKAFPNARYIDAYGLTESCGGDTLMEAGREIEKIGSVGRSLPQVEIEIRDEQGQVLPTGEHGEVCLRGAKVTKGYWHAPEMTAASFFGEWFRTGDVGYLDADGFLFLTDRKKDMIISGGENIASSEVERIIYELSEVRDAAVVGVPDSRWGERPVAFVVLHPGMTLTEAQIRTYCRERVAPFKVPDRVQFESALPRSASGKILKRKLRDHLAGEVKETLC